MIGGNTRVGAIDQCVVRFRRRFQRFQLNSDVLSGLTLLRTRPGSVLA
jgi:hypothetical protein